MKTYHKFKIIYTKHTFAIWNQYVVCRNQHSMTFQIPSACTDAYKVASFLELSGIINDLPDSLISSAELSDDCVS